MSMPKAKLPPGMKLVRKVSYRYPSEWEVVKGEKVERRWWEFWKPEYIYIYAVIEDASTP